MLENEDKVEGENEEMMSNKVALESIKDLHDYLQQNSDIKIDSLFVSGLRDLKWKIDKKRTASSTQTSIDTYWNNLLSYIIIIL